MNRQDQISLLKRLLNYVDTRTTAMAARPWRNEVSVYTDPERLADQGRRIEAINARYAGDGIPFRVLRSIEMDVFIDGSCDMDDDALAGLDLVLGAFHSKLRVTEDSTERYVAALRNPAVHVLAHPKARMYGRRVGLEADWPQVFAEAATLGKAVELDGTPYRQDLNVEMATIARKAGADS